VRNVFLDRTGFASSCDGQTLLRVSEDGFDLAAGHAWDHSRTSSMRAPSSRLATGLGTLVPRKTDAPLTVSEFRSTAEQLLQLTAKG
jgi:hypothetical protein